jgi:hypothetical protein
LCVGLVVGSIECLAIHLQQLLQHTHDLSCHADVPAALSRLLGLLLLKRGLCRRRVLASFRLQATHMGFELVYGLPHGLGFCSIMGS